MSKRFKPGVRTKARAKAEKIAEKKAKKYANAKAHKEGKLAAKHFKTHNNRVTNSSVHMKWRTPKSLLDKVIAIHERINLDPCADKSAKFQFAKINYSGPKGNGRDGLDLQLSWRGKGVVFVNPPYGRGLIKWVERLIFEFGAGRLALGKDHCYLLVPSRTDTKWFRKAYDACHALCLMTGRLEFGGPAADPAPFPSVVFYFGRKTKEFEKQFSQFGIVIVK